MDEFARFLRESREKSGLSLDEMAARTKIQRRYLAAMESGDFAQLPGEAYRRAFVKLYARELGLDTQEVLERYDLAAQPPRQEPVSSARERPALWQSAWLVFLLLSVLAAGILGGWYASRRLQLMQQEDKRPASSVYVDTEVHTEPPRHIDEFEDEDEKTDLDSELKLSYFGPGEFIGIDF
ncbi:MAG: helix-turn-helix domain-containing protein [Firmicutes bacterium]|jgi:cytoskeletal protein RodZ|nr:helix-turn-helix domain-containing protein [Bacillota bacterium]